MTGNVVAGADQRVMPWFGQGLVGRDRELTALTGALGHPPAVLLVEGEAGIGKSRLVRELLASPAGQEHRWLTITCPPLRDPFTLGPVVDAVRQATDRVTGLGLSGLAGALRPLFPEWAEDLPPAPEPVSDERASRHRLFRALVEVLDKLGATALVVEDAHWADEASMEFLLTLAASRPVSMVVTYRPEDVPADSLLPRLISRAPDGTTFARVTLGGLDAAGTGAFISAMLGGESISVEFAESINRNTGGIPFVIEQLVRLLHDRTDLIHRDGQWMRRRLGVIEVPPTVRDAVTERVARLPEAVRELLWAAAVLGDPTDETTLLEVAGFTDADASLTVALDSGLLVTVDGDRRAIRHALAATAIYDTIPTGRRRDLHLRAGRALEAVPGQSVARLAHHFWRAGQIPEWYRYAEHAAKQALAVGDRLTAAALLRDLVEHADRFDASVLGLVGVIQLSNARPAGRTADLIDALRAMLDRLDLSPEQTAHVRFPLARLLFNASRPEEARAEMLRVIPHLRDDPVSAARAMLSLAIPGGSSSPVTEHLRWLRAAEALPEPSDPAERFGFGLNRITVLVGLGQEEAWTAAATLPEDAPTARERYALATVRVTLADAATRWGWYDQARDHLDRALRLTHPEHDLGIREAIDATRLHVDWFTADWTGLADRAQALGNDDGFTQGQAEARLVTGLLALVNGDLEFGEEICRGFLARPILYPELTLEATAALARSLLERGRTDDAVRLTDEPMELAWRNGIWFRASPLAPIRIRALLAMGRGDDAAALVERLAAILRGHIAPAPRTTLALCRAMLAEHDGDPTRAAARYESVAAAWRAMPRPYEALLAEEREAGCLLAADREDDAVDVLRRAFTGLSELGAVRDADRIDQRLRDLGIRARRPGRRGYGDRLSPRELDVVRLVVKGMTNREIAATLSRSPKTIATQLNSAMRKLGTSSRTELAVRVVESGEFGVVS